LGRLVRSYDNTVGRPATDQELKYVFDRWCQLSRLFWRPGLTRDDYWAEFLEAYSYARIGLGEDPIPVALDRARRRPLPEVVGFGDERVKLLAGICRQLHEMMGGSSFFLPTRKLGELLDAHWATVARWLINLDVLGVIHLAPGETRRPGATRSPRYLYGLSQQPIGA
jgi:hypothetical protein